MEDLARDLRFAVRGLLKAVGRTLSLDGEPRVVIGVMPPGFEFPPFWATGAELWTPLLFDAETAAGLAARPEPQEISCTRPGRLS